jgi:hypothetical protein
MRKRAAGKSPYSKLETGSSKLYLRLLLHDVDIDCRRIAQESMYRRKKKIAPPATGGRMSEDHLGNMFFANELCHGVCDFFILQLDYLRAQILGKAKISLQRTLPFGIVIGTDIDVHDEKLSVDSLRHTGRTCHQILSRRI